MQKRRRRPTCFVSDSEYGPSSDPHALRIDKRRAQKSCNGAIYCRPSLLEHVPRKKAIFTAIMGNVWTQILETLECLQEASLNHVLRLEADSGENIRKWLELSWLDSRGKLSSGEITAHLFLMSLTNLNDTSGREIGNLICFPESPKRLFSLRGWHGLGCAIWAAREGKCWECFGSVYTSLTQSQPGRKGKWRQFHWKNLIERLLNGCAGRATYLSTAAGIRLHTLGALS